MQDISSAILLLLDCVLLFKILMLQFLKEVFSFILLKSIGVLMGNYVSFCGCKIISYFFFIIKNIYLLAVLGLHCCLFSKCSKQGLFSSCCAGASLVVAHRLQGTWASVGPYRGSVSAALGALEPWLVFVALRFSCFMACGIFQDKGSDLCALHCKVDS